MRLYDYWRSSAAYRVRIALNIKGLEVEQIPIDLRASGQHTEDYLTVNPQGLVPFLEDGDVKHQPVPRHHRLSRRNPPRTADPPRRRRRPRPHPRHRPDHRLRHPPAQQPAGPALPRKRPRLRPAQTHDLVPPLGRRRLQGLREPSIKDTPGDFCCGDQPTLADICLVPQVYNAKRYEVDLGPFPTIRTINDRCQDLEPFAKAAPQHQPGS